MFFLANASKRIQIRKIGDEIEKEICLCMLTMTDEKGGKHVCLRKSFRLGLAYS